jgi:hypothetical protein
MNTLVARTTLVALAAQRLPDDLLGLAPGVAVGGVDEVHALVERRVDDAHAVVDVVVAPAPEHHRAEADAGDLETGVAESSVFHPASVEQRRDR